MARDMSDACPAFQFEAAGITDVMSLRYTAMLCLRPM